MPSHYSRPLHGQHGGLPRSRRQQQSSLPRKTSSMKVIRRLTPSCFLCVGEKGDRMRLYLYPPQLGVRSPKIRASTLLFTVRMEGNRIEAIQQAATQHCPTTSLFPFLLHYCFTSFSYFSRPTKSKDTPVNKITFSRLLVGLLRCFTIACVCQPNIFIKNVRKWLYEK